MPLADYFQTDLGTEWCKPPEVSKTFKVYNNAPTFLVIFIFNIITAVAAGVATENYGLFGIIGSSIPMLALALASIKTVRREGDSLILMKWGGGTLNIKLANIESLKVGYKYSCCDCKHCGVQGEVGKNPDSNLLITLKQKIDCGTKKIIISIMDDEVQELIKSVVENQKTTEA